MLNSCLHTPPSLPSAHAAQFPMPRHPTRVARDGHVYIPKQLMRQLVASRVPWELERNMINSALQTVADGTADTWAYSINDVATGIAYTWEFHLVFIGRMDPDWELRGEMVLD